MELKKHLFTRLVRTLPADPGEPLMDAVWAALANALRTELRRRGLWDAPPSYLGVFGWEHWYDVERGGMASSGGLHSQGPLDELVAECFSYNFIDRLRSLVVQLGKKPTIDGLVRLNVRHFVYERQRHHDPLGFRVFEVLREAVEEGLRQGFLWTLDGSTRIANAVVLTSVRKEVSLTKPESLASVVRRWNDVLLPDLLLAVGRHREGLSERLVEHLEELPKEQVFRFRFKDLVDPLKADARLRWAELMAQGFHGGAPTLWNEPVSLPDVSLEERDRFQWLALRVATQIEEMEIEPLKREYLARLWAFLAPTSEAPKALEEKVLSHRRLSRQLNIPRDRMPDLMGSLAETLSQVRNTESSASSGLGFPGGRS